MTGSDGTVGSETLLVSGAITGVTIFYVLIAAGAVLALKQQLQAHGRPFAATLAELERDAEAMRRKP